MKLTESKLRRIVREELSRLAESEEKVRSIADDVYQIIDDWGLNPRKQENGHEIEVGDTRLYFKKESPVHFVVQLRGRGVARDFQFDLHDRTNKARAVLDRVDSFIPRS